MRNNKQETKFK